MWQWPKYQGLWREEISLTDEERSLQKPAKLSPLRTRRAEALRHMETQLALHSQLNCLYFPKKQAN